MIRHLEYKVLRKHNIFDIGYSMRVAKEMSKQIFLIFFVLVFKSSRNRIVTLFLEFV